MKLRRLLALLGLAPALALAQGLSPSLPFQTTGKTLAFFPLSTSGPLIAEDANTVSHVYWNGTALVDTKGNAWTQNGTVPQVSANPFTTTRYGAGPFSAANYYSLGTGTDVLDFAGDFTACVVYSANGTGANYGLVSTTDSNQRGWMLYSTVASGIVSMFTYDTGTQTVTNTVNGVANNGPSVACGGRSGTTQYVKLNLGATASSAGSKMNAATTVASTIGQRGGEAVAGTIYEVYATSSAWSEATVTAIQQKVLGHFDGYSALSVTRTTNATYVDGTGTLWTAAPGVARITTDGLLVEPQRINYALQSNTMSTGTAATSPWTLNTASVATVAGAPLTGTWAEVTSTTNVGSLYQSTTTASSTTHVGSFWMSKASGTGSGGFIVYSGGAQTPTSCTCVRSTGGACTATTSGSSCVVYVTDLGTAPERLSAVVTWSAAITTPWIQATGGVWQVSTGTTRYTGAQLEVGAYPTSLIVTTTTSATRNADAVSATVPTVPSKWCIATTAKTAEGRAWGDDFLWGLPDHSSANAAYCGSKVCGVRDSGAAVKTFTATADASAGSHRFVFCDSQGSLASSLDGTLRAGTLGGAGSGIQTTPSTTLNFGASGGAAFHMGGFLKNLKLCAASNAKGCK